MIPSIDLTQLKTLFEEEKAVLERRYQSEAFKVFASTPDGMEFIRQTAADRASIRAIQLLGLHTEEEAATICEVILRFVAK